MFVKVGLNIELSIQQKPTKLASGNKNMQGMKIPAIFTHTDEDWESSFGRRVSELHSFRTCSPDPLLTSHMFALFCQNAVSPHLHQYLLQEITFLRVFLCLVFSVHTQLGLYLDFTCFNFLF